jgi:hypothetical protein
VQRREPQLLALQGYREEVEKGARQDLAVINQLDREFRVIHSDQIGDQVIE